MSFYFNLTFAIKPEFSIVRTTKFPARLRVRLFVFRLNKYKIPVELKLLRHKFNWDYVRHKHVRSLLARQLLLSELITNYTQMHTEKRENKKLTDSV